mmetsp:Transcript_22144/g.50679  ORF Transcript_22144/g.50679 Transcript_22144/m.50679 type:complete len:158 (-) Transcript_22144:1815-2288(-)
MRTSAIIELVTLSCTAKYAAAFVVNGPSQSSGIFGTLPNRYVRRSSCASSSSRLHVMEKAIDKRTGISYLPEETIARMEKGGPIEKHKFKKDPTAAFDDVYSFAAAIRSGEMDWKDLEAGDLDFVSKRKWQLKNDLSYKVFIHHICCNLLPCYALVI